MAKAIIWRRGSTDRQEIETQDKDLTAMAIGDGFKVKDLIHIGQAGASAIKQNDLYLNEVNELLSTLDNDPTVKTVYVWEISRLARVELAFYRMKDYFITHQVQLVCKTPSLRLFDSDGKVNKGAELTLSLLVTLAKQEMEIKQERFARAKARNKAEGKFNGGKIKIGYKLDEHNYFIIDEERAKVIRQVFDWFVNGGLSLTKIFAKLVDMGVYSTINIRNACGKRVGYLLRDPSYKGEGNYPRIVDDEIWAKAQKMMSERCKPHESKNIYYCKGILRDKATGFLFTAKFGRLTYVMRCDTHSIALNINAMDFIALHTANILYANVLCEEAQTNKNDYVLKIKENNALIVAKQKQVEEYRKAIERAVEMNVMQPKYFPTEKMNAIIKNNETQISTIEKAISNLQVENTRMENWFNGNQKFLNAIKDYDDSKRKELINQVMECIEVSEIGKHHFRIEVKNKLGYISDEWWEYRTHGNTLQIVWFTGRGEWDMTQKMKREKRFERKRYEN